MKNRLETDELWEDLIGDVASDEFRREALAGAMAAVGSRRRRRKAGYIAFVVLPVLLLLALQLNQNTFSENPVVMVLPEISEGVILSSQQAGEEASEMIGLKILTDEELFGMFPGRAMALISSQGDQELVFLGR